MPQELTVLPGAGFQTPAHLSNGSIQLPALFSPDAGTARRVIEFFTANIRNPYTRKAYAKAGSGFAAWCEARGPRTCATCNRSPSPLNSPVLVIFRQSAFDGTSSSTSWAEAAKPQSWALRPKRLPTTGSVSRNCGPCFWSTYSWSPTSTCC